MANVASIVKSGLCQGCGTCYAVCGHDAIRIDLDRKKGTFSPVIEQDRCVDCGLCLRACPGGSVDFVGLNAQIFGLQPDDAWLGHYEKCYILHAASREIRLNASSGGAATAILMFCFEKKIIDGALVVRMNQRDPLIPEVVMARNREEVINSMGSKYCPVPVNAGLREILKRDGRYAMVGLPCHLHGIRKLEAVHKIVQERLVLRLGLMCSNTASLLGTEYFLRNRGIEPSEVLDFKYRGKGWIGYISVTRRNGKQHLFPRQITKPFDQVLHSVSFHTGFAVRRCLVCCDHTAEFSDMSLGDPRLPELVRSERIGQSLVLTRNAVAESILGQAESQGFLRVVEQIDRDRFFVAQNISFKRGFNTHLRAHRFMGIPVPQYITPKLQSSKAFEAMRILSYLPCYLSERRSLWPLFLPYGYVIRYASRFLGYYRALKRRFGRVSPLAEAGNGP